MYWILAYIFNSESIDIKQHAFPTKGIAVVVLITMNQFAYDQSQ